MIAIAGDEGVEFDPPPVRRGALSIVCDARIDGVSHARSAADHILDAYERFGEDCTLHLIGDYAFAIWDGDRRRLVCGRDDFGVRQLYYARSGGRTIVASSLAAMLPHVGNELDVRTLALFIIGEHDVDTVYAQVKRVPPASVVIVDGGDIRISRGWTTPLDGAIRYRHHDDYVDHFRALLDVAVRDRVRGNSAAAMMSGGLDSTSVAVTAQRLLRERDPGARLQAYTTNFSSMFRDEEARYASFVAGASGMRHHVIARDEQTLFADASAYQRAQPFEDPLAGVFLELAREASRHSDVLLAGQGGDAIFYTSHGYFRGLVKRMRWLTFIGDVTRYILRTGKRPPLNLRSAVQQWFGVQPWRAEFPPWLRSDVVERFHLREHFEAEPMIATPHPLRPEAHKLLGGGLWQRLFETWDRGETGIPIDVVYPFFDRRIIEFVFALPPMPWFADKYLLRESMRGRLPESVRTRPKTPLPRDPMRILFDRSQPEIARLLADAEEIREFVDVPRLLEWLSRGARDPYGDQLAANALCLARWFLERRLHVRS